MPPGPEGGGEAGSAAEATAGDATAGMGLTLQAAQSRALPPPSSPVSLARGLCVFQNIRAGTHIRHFPLIQSFCFTNGETKAQRSCFIHPNLHS